MSLHWVGDSPINAPLLIAFENRGKNVTGPPFKYRYAKNENARRKKNEPDREREKERERESVCVLDSTWDRRIKSANKFSVRARFEPATPDLARQKERERWGQCRIQREGPAPPSPPPNTPCFQKMGKTCDFWQLLTVNCRHGPMDPLSKFSGSAPGEVGGGTRGGKGNRWRGWGRVWA